MTERPDRLERQWWRRNNKAPSLLLEIPEADAAAVIGCLALGTLAALKARALKLGAGDVLARLRSDLRGKVPPLLLDALSSMEDLDALGGHMNIPDEAVDRLMSELIAVLRTLPTPWYDLGWVPEPEPAEPGRLPRRGSNGEMPYPDPIDDGQVFHALCSGIRGKQAGGAQEWASFDELMQWLGRADPDQVRRSIEHLLWIESIEQHPDAEKWRPTQSGWREYEHEKRVSRPGLWDQYGVEE